jgi:uncharacterized protein (TIGR02270 family)
MTREVIPEIVGQHVEDGSFLWLLRERATVASDIRLADLADLDLRLEAHVDALRIAGARVEEVCGDALVQVDPGAVFLAGVRALEARDNARLQDLLAMVAEQPSLRSGLASAFAWVSPRNLRGTVLRLLASPVAVEKEMAITACTIHGAVSEESARLLLADADPSVRACALRAAGEAGLTGCRAAVLAQLQADDIEARFWAAWSSMLLGERQLGLEALQPFVCEPAAFGDVALAIVVLGSSPAETRGWLKAVAASLTHPRLIRAIGLSGDPFYVPWLIGKMRAPETARLAGEAFGFITGVDLAATRLEGAPPEGFVAGPTEDPDDGDVEADPDEGLAWPDGDKVEAWWLRNQGFFTIGKRYLVGERVSGTRCGVVLREGLQRQRAAAALSASLLQPGLPVFRWQAPAWRQQRELGLA